MFLGVSKIFLSSTKCLFNFIFFLYFLFVFPVLDKILNHLIHVLLFYDIDKKLYHWFIVLIDGKKSEFNSNITDKNGYMTYELFEPGLEHLTRKFEKAIAISPIESVHRHTFCVAVYVTVNALFTAGYMRVVWRGKRNRGAEFKLRVSLLHSLSHWYPWEVHKSFSFSSFLSPTPTSCSL